MGQSRPLSVYFRYFLITISIIQIEKSVDGVLGIRNRGRRTRTLLNQLYTLVSMASRHRSVDSSGPFILRPRVRTPSKPLRFIEILLILLSVIKSFK